MKKLGLIIAAAAMVAFAGSAYALPASKAAIVQGDLFGLATACVIEQQTGGGLTCDNPPTGTDPSDTGFVTVMTTFIKTPNGKELALDVALQCGLITFTEAKAKTTGGGGKGDDKAAAEGRIQVRVALTPVDKDGVSNGDTFYAVPNDDSISSSLEGPGSGDSGPDGVTYCFRFQKLEVSFDNLVCETGKECEISVSLLLETLAAHAFNFVAPNVEPGIKRIEVQARATADADIFGGDGSTKGEAFVGMGSMLVETVRAIQSFDENTAINPVITDLD